MIPPMYLICQGPAHIKSYNVSHHLDTNLTDVSHL